MNDVEEFTDILQLFNTHCVEHAVFGAQAMIAHGVTRYTGDLDLWVNPTASNLQRMVCAFNHFGVPRSFLPLDEQAFLASEHHGFNIGRAPACIDIHNRIFGLSHPKLQFMEVHGVQAPCLRVDELVRSKVIAGRPQDLADILNILKAHPA